MLRYVGPVRGRGNTTRLACYRDLIHDPAGYLAALGAQKALLSRPECRGRCGVRRRALLRNAGTTPQRWTANISGPGGALRFAPNQVEFLVGLMSRAGQFSGIRV